MPKFNPQKIEKVVISLRIEENMVKQIDKLADERDISRNEFIIQCIQFAVKDLSEK